jgi:hypothetical protein
MNNTVLSEETKKELKELVQIIDDNSLPFPTLSVEIQEYEKQQIEKANKRIYEIIKTL